MINIFSNFQQFMNQQIQVINDETLEIIYDFTSNHTWNPLLSVNVNDFLMRQ